jgi:hypothetical protein
LKTLSAFKSVFDRTLLFLLSQTPASQFFDKRFQHRLHHARIVVHSLSNNLERKSLYQFKKPEGSIVKRQKLLGTRNPRQVAKGASPQKAGTSVCGAVARGRRHNSIEKTLYVKFVFFNGRTFFHNLTMACV